MIRQSTDSIVPERRIAARLPIRLATRVEAFDRPVDHRTAGMVTTLHDLSKNGAALRNVSGFGAGSLVRLHVPAVGWRHLEIRWQAGDHAGGRFLLPLLDHELRAALQSGRPRDRSGHRSTLSPAAKRPARAAARAIARLIADWGDRIALATRRPAPISIPIAGRTTLARLR